MSGAVIPRPSRVLITLIISTGAVTGCGLAELLQPPTPVQWMLSVDEAIDADTQDFTALITAPGCTGGVTERSRVVGPEIEYTDDAVIVSFGYRLPGGAQTCPGGPPVGVTVTLSEPLGARQPLVGGVDPPAAPTLCDLAERFCLPGDGR